LTRFITSPDKPEDLHNVILLVDFSADEIAEAAYACKVCEKDFDVFLFSPVDKDRDWLDWVFAHADCCIVNLSTATNMLVKAQFLSYKKTFGVGTLELVPKKKLESLPEYFKKQDNDGKK